MGFGNYTSTQTKDIAQDAVGNIYITTNSYDSADFDPGAGTNYLGGTHVLLTIDSNGNVLWGKDLDQYNSRHLPQTMAIDPNGKVLLTGNFKDTCKGRMGATGDLCCRPDSGES